MPDENHSLTSLTASRSLSVLLDDEHEQSGGDFLVCLVCGQTAYGASAAGTLARRFTVSPQKVTRDVVPCRQDCPQG